MGDMINLFYPTIFRDEWLTELGKIFNTRWIGQGPVVDKFEKEFGDKFGYNHCLSLNSGTATLELAYHLIGISGGDEVLVPVFTCTATNIPLLRRGAKLVFTDINRELVTDYEDVVKKITKKTKAIVVVNLGGIQNDEKIFDLARRCGIPVVVDAAQSVGIGNERGNYVCYSFQAIKHFTTGDGGMLVIKDEEQYYRAKKLRWFGIDREAKKRADWKTMVNHQMAMDIEEAGYKYHMNDIAATLGLVGLKHSDEILEYRRKLCRVYFEGLSDFELVYGGACWLIAILVEGRDDLMDYLFRNGVESDLIQIRNDVFRVFGGKRRRLPTMNELEGKYLYLPIHPNVTVEDVSYITREICQWKS